MVLDTGNNCYTHGGRSLLVSSAAHLYGAGSCLPIVRLGLPSPLLPLSSVGLSLTIALAHWEWLFWRHRK